jgi:hypothetical protein
MSLSYTLEQARVLEEDLFYLARAADTDTRAPLFIVPRVVIVSGGLRRGICGVVG